MESTARGGEKIPDLSDADLSSGAISDANLSGANLSLANLSAADLSGANLSDRQPQRRQPQLAPTSATPTSAVPTSTSANSPRRPTSAAPTSATPTSATPTSATPTSATPTSAERRPQRRQPRRGRSAMSTVFANVDLSDAKGLDSVEHSWSEHCRDRYDLSLKGQDPRAFSAAAACPNTSSSNQPSLIGSMEPIQFYSCFISYSSKNQAFAERLHADLQAKGVRTTGSTERISRSATRSAPGSTKRSGSTTSSCLCSANSQSRAIGSKEKLKPLWRGSGREKRIVLFPIRLDDSVMETPVAWASTYPAESAHRGLPEWENHGDYQNAFARLLRDLKSEESTGAKNT